MVANDPPNVSLRLYLLGGFRAERGGEPILDSAWVRPMAKALLKLLAVEPGHRLHRERIQDLLWPDLDPDAGHGSFRKALHLARHALEPHRARNRYSTFLRLADGVLSLDTDRVWIDADTFEQSMEQALAVTQAGGILEALTLYTGSLLPEDIYEEWTEPRRRDLAELERQGLLRLADLRAETGDLGAAAKLLQRVVRADPSDEATHRQLMRLHAQAGSRHLALRQYALCADVLRRELDTEPSEETVALYEEILAGRPPMVAAPADATRPPPPLPSSAPHKPLGPFIARERPKALLLQALGVESGNLPAPRGATVAEAEPGTWSLESDSPRLILVGGEAGVGKTRLLLEVAREAGNRGALVLWGSSYESEGKIAYGPLIEAIRAHLAGRPDAERAAVVARFPKLCALLPIVPDAAVDRAPSHSSERERAHLYTGMVRLLAELSASESQYRPLLFVLDDVHEADLATLQILHHLAREAARRDWLLVGTYREEAVDGNSGFARWVAGTAGRGLCQRVDLFRLARVECDRLVCAMLDQEPDPVILERVYALSLGNPLFAGELVAAQRESAIALAPAGGAAVGIGGDVLCPSAWSVPQRVREFVAARVDALGTGARHVLALAATAGMEWPFAVLATAMHDALADGLPPSTLLDVLDRALEMRIVEERTSSRGEAVYGFRHPLFREALYERLSSSRRQHLHLALARAVEEHQPGDVEALANHYSRGGDARQASIYLEQAGDRAASVFANELAVTYYKELVKQLDALERPCASAGVRVKLARVLALIAQTDEALEQLDRAAAAYRAAGDLEAEVRATADLALVHSQRGRPREGIQRLQPLLEPLAALGPSSSLVTAHLAIAGLSFAAGEYRKQLEASETASAVARDIGVGALHARAEIRRGAALAMLGRLKEANAAAQAALPALEAAGDLPLLARTLNNMAWSAMLAGDFEQNKRYAERALETARQVGDPALIAVDTSSLGRAHFYTNEWATARSLMDQGLRALQALGPSWHTAYAYFYLGQLATAEGDWEEARRLLAAATDIGHEAGDLQALRPTAVWFAEMDLWDGQLELARERLEPLVAIDAPEEPGQGPLEDLDALFVLAALARVYQRLARAGKLPAVPRPPAEMTAYAVERSRSLEINLYLLIALCAHGEVLALRDEWERAQAALGEALSLGRAMNYHWGQVMTLRALALLHQLRGEPEQRRDRIMEARTILRHLGAQRMAARFTELLCQPVLTVCP